MPGLIHDFIQAVKIFACMVVGSIVLLFVARVLDWIWGKITGRVI